MKVFRICFLLILPCSVSGFLVHSLTSASLSAAVSSPESNNKAQSIVRDPTKMRAMFGNIELGGLMYDSTATALDAWSWTSNICSPAALVAGAVLVSLNETRERADPCVRDSRWVKWLKRSMRFLLLTSFAFEVVAIFVGTMTGSVLLGHGQQKAAKAIGYASPLQLLHHHHEFEYLTTQICFLQGLFHWLAAVAMELMLPKEKESIAAQRMNHCLAAWLGSLLLWMLAFYNNHLSFYSDYAAMLSRFAALFTARYLKVRPLRPMSLLYANRQRSAQNKMDKDKYSPQNHQPLECDYDRNPTILYQAIEAKRWDAAIGLFAADKCAKQSATWVVRKETSGKLRWRLLPLHAAIIFGCPLQLVECLLADYAGAAQCKDDQGMLPLHLAFRNEGGSSWEIIQELLTAYPQAIFIKDRKGRTPLDCGLQLSGNSSVATSPTHSNSFKSIVGVLQLYSQVVVSGDRQRSQQEAIQQAEDRIHRMQESHLQTLTTLKREWNHQQEESKKQLVALRQDKQHLEDTVHTQQHTIDRLKASEADLESKIANMAVALNQQGHTSRRSQEPNTDVLRSMVEDLVDQQKEYHHKFRSLMAKFETLMDERKAIQAVFVKESEAQASQEEKMIGNLKHWVHEKELLLQQQQELVGDSDGKPGSEEKKVENVREFVERPSTHGPKMMPLPRPALSTEDVIDLSHVASTDSGC
eukprot:Nitzschia sp. Nitz4//scaffold79_size90958//87558//90409//NITZ4_005042-RA/size90958-augustus-gene-0.180-mRNA-1//-1//CDS//3329558300//7310//frame0